MGPPQAAPLRAPAVIPRPAPAARTVAAAAVVVAGGRPPEAAVAMAERVAIGMATERPATSPGSRRPAGANRRLAGRGPDRLSVILLGLAAFLAILALLASQLRGAPSQGYTARAVVVRRIYLTRVIDSSSAAGGGSSVSQSMSSSPSSYSAAAPVTTHTS